MRTFNDLMIEYGKTDMIHSPQEYIYDYLSSECNMLINQVNIERISTERRTEKLAACADEIHRLQREISIKEKNVERLQNKVLSLEGDLRDAEDQMNRDADNIFQIQQRLDTSDSGYQDLIRIATCLYKADKEAIHQMICEGLDADDYWKFRKHIAI